MRDIDTMREYTLEEISEIVGGILTKLEDVKISRLGPPLLADENTLALALNEDEIENLSKTKAKAALVPIGVTSEMISTIEAERPRLAMMKLLHLCSSERNNTSYGKTRRECINRAECSYFT